MNWSYVEHLTGYGDVRRQTFDAAVVGGGFVGMAVAAELAARGLRVANIDKTDDPGLHITDRAPAMLDPVGVPHTSVTRLMLMSRELYSDVQGALHPKAALHLYDKGHLRHLLETHKDCHGLGLVTEVHETHDVEAHHSFIRLGEDHCAGALYVPEAAAHLIDLRKVYEHNRSRFVAHRGHVFHHEEVLRGRYSGGAWTINSGGELIRARLIVNCAGAGAGDVAARCDLPSRPLEHRHYTHLKGAVVAHGPAPDPEAPVVTWHGHSPLRAHFDRPGHVHLTLPTEHHEIGDDETRTGHGDLGHAVERMMHRTHLVLGTPHRRHWTETRTFTADHRPLVGLDPEAPGFAWAAGFGSHGPQCAAAAAKLVTGEIMGDRHLADPAGPYGVTLEEFTPGRWQTVSVHPD
jgi:glycine/D-amino acid oxidase-like deaminating enzyme